MFKLLVSVFFTVTVLVFPEKIPYQNFRDNYINIPDYVSIFPSNLYKKTFLSKVGIFYLLKNESKKNFTEQKQCIQWGKDFLQRVLPIIREEGSILDIGARQGFYTVFLSLNTINHAIHSFEAELFRFRELILNVQSNYCLDVSVYRFLMGDENKKVNEYKGWPVDMITLDSLNLKDLCFARLHLQGLEEKFLIGASETLKSLKPVLVITLLSKNNRRKASYPERYRINRILRTIRKLGYKVEDFFGDDYLCIPVVSETDYDLDIEEI